MAQTKILIKNPDGMLSNRLEALNSDQAGLMAGKWAKDNSRDLSSRPHTHTHTQHDFVYTKMALA